MCLAIPVRIVALEPDAMAVVEIEGIRKQVSVALIEAPAIGDYVLLHVGYALHKLSEAEAERTLAMMAEAGLLASDELEASP
ncbi:MAG: HypC/HybG/HupF family hydrogenase formation chaperone [Rhodospirillales bacterium]|nr:HypC/HybG/HupF family hydrogenase formation chaperone [Rhodospirillales bacterium]